MTGKEWSDYFETLEDNYREILRESILTISNNEMFRKAYGNDFRELSYIISYPLSKLILNNGKDLIKDQVTPNTK